MVKARKFIIVDHFKDWPKESDLKIVEEDLAPVKDGGKCVDKYFVFLKLKLYYVILYRMCSFFYFVITEFLAEALYLSIDPYMRAYAYRYTKESTMIGSQVAR